MFFIFSSKETLLCLGHSRPTQWRLWFTNKKIIISNLILSAQNRRLTVSGDNNKVKIKLYYFCLLFWRGAIKTIFLIYNARALIGKPSLCNDNSECLKRGLMTRKYSPCRISQIQINAICRRRNIIISCLKICSWLMLNKSFKVCLAINAISLGLIWCEVPVRYQCGSEPTTKMIFLFRFVSISNMPRCAILPMTLM